MVQAQKRRRRPMELLAGVIRPQKPLGHKGKQHQRRQQRPAPAQIPAELPVKRIAHRGLAHQHHKPEKQQHAGRAAGHSHKRRQQRRRRQAGKLVRLPHRVEQPVPADEPEPQRQRVLFVDFQPHKGAAHHDRRTHQAEQGRTAPAQPHVLRRHRPAPSVLCSRVSRRQYQQGR